MIKKVKSNKGFTLIELIVVIAVIGLLVLLASPKLLGYTEDAKVAQIKADIKTNEDIIETERVSNSELFNDWTLVEKEALEKYRDSNSLYDKEGYVKDSYELEDKSFEIPEASVNSKLKGAFYVSEGGKVFYQDDNLVGNNEPEEPQEDITALCDGHPNLASDDDFSMSYDGNFSYVGSDTTVCIPHVIKGEDVTSYNKMFEYGDVDTVISDNENVTDMSNMFYYSDASSLNLSRLDTSSVTNMSEMFRNSQATSLNLSDFDTSSVKYMNKMFSDSQAISLDLSGFDTSNVTNMEQMFSDSQATSLDLSGFDTSNVTQMDLMFWNSQATSLDLSSFDISKVTNTFWMFYSSKATSGFARTQADADEFNSSRDIPAGLTFTVK